MRDYYLVFALFHDDGIFGFSTEGLLIYPRFFGDFNVIPKGIVDGYLDRAAHDFTSGRAPIIAATPLPMLSRFSQTSTRKGATFTQSGCLRVFFLMVFFIIFVG